MGSRAREDYLKTIYELEENVGIAKTTQLAQKLGVKAATVTEMVQRLSKESPRVVTYQHHHGVRLTPTGRFQALGIIRRHRLLETFLHRTLGLNWDEVHEEAEVLEHHLSRRVTDAIDQYLDYPEIDPHGEPIPNQWGILTSQSNLQLSDINTGQAFKITRVNPISGDFLAYLQQLSIRIQTTGRILSKAPEKGPITVLIQGQDSDIKHTVERNISDHIYVELM